MKVEPIILHSCMPVDDAIAADDEDHWLPARYAPVELPVDVG